MGPTRTGRFWWMVPLLMVAALSFGITSALDDRWREAVTWSIVLVVGVSGMAWRLTRVKVSVAHARQAAAAAQRATSPS